MNDEKREYRKRGEQYLYGMLGGCGNIIFWIVLAIVATMILRPW